jgi:hypothetical protein
MDYTKNNDAAWASLLLVANHRFKNLYDIQTLCVAAEQALEQEDWEALKEISRITASVGVPEEKKR